MRQEADDTSGAPRRIEVSIPDVLLLAIGSAIGGALLAALLAFSLPRLFGWHPAICRGIGFFFLSLFLYAPMKVRSEVKGRPMVRGVKFLLVWTLASILVALLNFLMP